MLYYLNTRKLFSLRLNVKYLKIEKKKKETCVTCLNVNIDQSTNLTLRIEVLVKSEPGSLVTNKIVGARMKFLIVCV